MRKKSGLFRSSTILMLTAFIGVFALLLGARTDTLSADNVDNTRAEADLTGITVGVSETDLYVVRLQDASLAAYEGGVAGLAATSPRVTGQNKLDVNAPESVAYLNYLREKQNEFIGAMENSLGRSVEVEFQYLNVLNALAVRVEHDEAQHLATLPGVKAVYPDQLRELVTDVGPILIGAPTFWEGDLGHDEHRGEGVIIGFLDTGVNPEHPSFAEVSPGDDYVHDNPYGSGNFVGVCDPSEPDYDATFPCNDKLIGAWNFHPSSPGAWDWHSHGSHVGGTIAGNLHDAVFTVGTDTFTRTISGVAPRANVISYLVCDPTCPSTSSVAATEQAIDDGVDVLNYSISGGDDPWNDMVDLAFLDATAAGMFVSASAGNDGPGPGTVAKTGPWNAAVAASTHNRVIANTVDATAPTQPPELQGMAAVPGTGPEVTTDVEEEIIWAGDVDVDNIRGCDPFPAGSFAGAIALMQRGDCTFATKVDNANAAGAVAAIVYNHVGGPPIVMGGLEGTTIPAVFLDDVDGDNLAAFASANPGDAEARINAATSVIENDNWQDVLAGFSSRGPSQWDLLKPDYTAPGVNILAAGFDGPDHYVFMGGTSMSSPHGAGAAALLVQRHPGWTPAEVKSALAMTAWQDLLKEDGVTPADFFDMGSGRIDLTMAAQIGLVMDETIANYEDANPHMGGDPKTLNQPSMVDQNCLEECSWTRTVRSVADGPVTYNAVVDAPTGMTITVEPASFTIDPGATQTLTVTVEADLDALPAGDWAFAQVELEVANSTANQGDISSLSGSFVAFDPSIGGDSSYIPGEAQTFCFSAESFTDDWEWAHSVWQKFPEDWEVTDVYVEGTPFCQEGGSFQSFSWDYYLTRTHEIQIDHQRWHANPVDHCVAHYCFDVTTAPAANPAPVSWYWTGDGWGAPPNNPCSDDGYTPDGEAACDEAVNPVAQIPGPLLEEGFEDETFPPTGWERYELGDVATPPWVRTTAFSHSGDASAFQNYNTSAYLDNWLVTPVLSATEPVHLHFYERAAFMSWYTYSGVWVSADSCDPADGDFVEVYQVEDTSNFDWRLTAVDLSDYAGEDICIAFRYSGDDGHTWYVDDVMVFVAPEEDVGYSPVRLPIAVVPQLNAPVITVNPDEMNPTQMPDEVTTQTLTIGNEGGVDLNWTIDEAEPTAFNPVSLAGPLVVDCDAEPGIIIHDDGTINNGYSGNPDVVDEVMFVDPFTPSNYPAVFEAVCVAFISLGPTTLDFDIVLFADDGPDGEPGAELGSISASASGIPIWPAPTPVWHSYDISSLDVTLESGSVYIGVRWEPPSPNVFIAADQNTATPLTGGYWWSDNNPVWTPIQTNFPDYRALFVRAVADVPPPACESPSDVPWLSADPESGVTEPDGSSNVTVTFDSTGLLPGEYHAYLCVNSDDPNTPLVEVPVMLEVVPGVEIEVSPESMESTQAQDTITTQTLTISNIGEGVLDWEIEEAEPVTVGPVPMAILNLPVGGDRANPSSPEDRTAPASIMPTASNQLLSDWSEGFDDITLLPGLGWALINNSEPLGLTDWFQGNPDVFPSHSGAPDSYIGANFNNTSGSGTISNWLLTPEITMNNGDEFTFWTRRTGSQWEDRLQVRLSTSGDSTDVGDGAFDVGDFTELLLDINPDYEPGGYPAVWTEYTITISGLSDATDGRIAFRYFVEDGGPAGTYSDYIGIDTVSYTAIDLSACANPTDISWLSVNPASGSTPAGESDDVTVTLDSTGLDAGVYEALLCVFSNDPINPLVEAPVTMTVEELAYGVELSPATAAASGAPGEVVSYTLTITNTGNANDSFSFAASGYEWDITLPMTVTLDAGESVEVVVTVEIPANAADGATDTVTVTAASVGDETVTASSELTTTAEVDEYILYLPIILKP